MSDAETPNPQSGDASETADAPVAAPPEASEAPPANGVEPEPAAADEPALELTPEAAAPDAEPASVEVPEAAGTPDGAETHEVVPDADRPLIGPRIIGMAPPERPPAPVQRLARPRRRRPTAADRHRRAFFQKLGEMRREGRPEAPEAPPADAVEEVVGEAPEIEETAAIAVDTPEVEAAAPDVEAVAETDEPAAEAETTDSAPESEPEAAGEAEPQPEPEPEAPARRPEPAPLDARARARLSVAIERVGGPPAIQAALVPKQDEAGAPKRWALVCCESAMGIPPGDPIYLAWLRLASTPVREVKSAIRALEPEKPDRGRGRGGERSGRPRDGGARREGGGDRGGDRGGGRSSRGPRPDRDRDRVPAGAGLDGSFTPKIRIVTDDSAERAERDRLRKEEREAKRRAAQERLDRLGF